MHPLKAPSGNQCFHILPSPQGRPSVPASWDSPNPFDSALPCSNPLPSAGQAGVTCSDLSGLSCLPLPLPPPPPTSQLPCCYQAVASEVSQGPGGHWRHLALLRSRSLQHQGLPPRRTACDSLSLSTCPSSSCMPTRCLPQDAMGVAMGGSQRAVVPLSVIPIPVIRSCSLGTQEAAFRYHPGAHLQ